ncbi:MAG: DEAD/DEAH box helicase, partial [Myxococcaceae bacterium]
RNQSYAEAVRLFEAGGDARAALRAALAGKDPDAAKRITQAMPADQARQVLEKAGAWELLMERYVTEGDFDSVAKLYERARQFDQAALAWEKAGKLPAARRAFERVRDFKNALRIRNLEVDKLVERGDRLGAATLLIQAGRKEEAAATLLSLPAPKAFRFLERLKLDDAAKALAERELAKAEAENKPAAKARWLEMLDDNARAAEAWEQAGRLDRATVANEKSGNLSRAAQQAEVVGELDRAQDLYRRAGDTQNMERVAALPRPEKTDKKPAVDREDEEFSKQAAEGAESPLPEQGERQGEGGETP